MTTVAQRILLSAYYLPILFFIVVAGASFPINVLASSPVHIIEDEFIKDISAGWKSFEVCEYRSPGEDRTLFYGRALNLKPTTGGKVIESKDFVVRESTGSRGVHLGIVELEFPTIQLAERVHKPNAETQRQYFSGTKILTRYVSLRKERRVLLVYSETYGDAKVNGFFGRLGSLRSRLWTD